MKDRSRQHDAGLEKRASSQTAATTNIDQSAKPYETPVLVCYGDVRDITLGGTLGFGESGAANDFAVLVPN